MWGQGPSHMEETFFRLFQNCNPYTETRVVLMLTKQNIFSKYGVFVMIRQKNNNLRFKINPFSLLGPAVL